MKLEDFKTGQKYRKTSEACLYPGEIGVCTKIRSSGVVELTLENDSNYIYECFNNPENWEPVEYEPSYGEKIHMFAIGDYKYTYIGKTADGRIITQTAGTESVAIGSYIRVFIWPKGCKPFKVKKEEVKELTLAEIADKFNLDVKNIRIKEGN